MALRILQQPDDSHHGGGIDGPALRLVVETDIAPRDRNRKRLAGFGHPFHDLTELPHDGGFFRVSKVQAVGGGQRLPAPGPPRARPPRPPPPRAPPPGPKTK